MKKSKFVLLLAALFVIFAVTACDGKKSKKDKDDTEELEDSEDSEKNDYLTQDLATFDLRGQVVAVKYTGDQHTEPVTVLFEEDGSLKGIYKFDVEGNIDEATVYPDAEGRIETIAFPTEDPWVTTLLYDDNSMLPVSDIGNNHMGNGTCRMYERDEDGNIVKTTFEETVHGGVVEDNDPYSVELSDIDEHGNWRRVTFKHGDYSHFLKRTIVYKGEENILADEVEEAMGELAMQDFNDGKLNLEIADFITDMYENQRYNDYDFLEAHCTKRLLKYLREQYEYDGEGYAVWLFRTSSQDGKPGAENTKDKVTDITKDGDDWYRYKFTDGGWRGENKLNIYFDEDGNVMMDAVECIYDEAKEAYDNNQ